MTARERLEQELTAAWRSFEAATRNGGDVSAPRCELIITAGALARELIWERAERGEEVAA